MPAKPIKRRKKAETTVPHDSRHTPPELPDEMLEAGLEMPSTASQRLPRLFLSRGEVSRLFGVSVSTVTRWARLRLLKVVRTPGGHYRFPAEETYRAAGRGATGELTRLD